MVPGSIAVIYTRDLAILQSCPHIRVSFQHMVLKKKTHKLHIMYLSNDVQAYVLA